MSAKSLAALGLASVLAFFIPSEVKAQSTIGTISALANQRGKGSPTSVTEAAGGSLKVVNSQSYTYAVPFFALPGRHGLDLNLALIYNSAVWNTGGGVVWSPDTGYGFYTPFPGFRLDFGNLIWYETTGLTQGVLIDASGAKHPLMDTTGQGTTFSTTDSTHITIQHHASTGSNDPATDLATYPNGMQVSYQYGLTSALGNTIVMQPNKIQDVMGNAIVINYSGGNQFTIPNISSIADTAGRTINFIYGTVNGQNVLSCVTDAATCGATGSHTFTFKWTGNYILNYNFSNLVGYDGWSSVPPLQGSQTPYTVLSGVTRPDGTSVQFSYGDWLIVNDIKELSSNGTLRYEASYNFPAASSGALSTPPTYSQQTVTTFDKDGNQIQAVWSNQATLATSGLMLCSALTDPNGIINMTAFSNSGDVFDGMPIQTIIGTGSSSPCTSAPTTILRTTKTQWTSDSSSGTFTGVNMRLQTVTAILDDGTTRSQVQPTYDSNGNLTDLKESDFGSGTPGALLRETVATYATNTGNVVNRPSDVKVKDGGGNVISHTALSYDGNGNVTSSTAYANASQDTGGIAGAFTYDSYGNMLTAQSGCCTSKEWSYSSTTKFAYPDSVTVGPSANPASLTTSFTYNMSTGTVANVKDPNNQITSFTYDADNRLKQQTTPDGVTLTNSYDDTSSNPGVSTSNSANSRVTKSISDFLGRRLSNQSLNGATVVSTTAIINDPGGRPYKVSNPYGPLDAALYTTYTYDALGRVTLTTPPALAGVTQQNGYQANPSGSTVTLTDPAGNQRKQYFDGLGRLIEVDEPGAAFAGTPSTGTLKISGSLEGSFTVTGNEQSSTTSPQTATGWVNISGYEQTITKQHCQFRNNVWVCFPIQVPDTGTIGITVGSYPQVPYNYGSTDSAYTIASNLAGALTSGSAVTASVSGGTNCVPGYTGQETCTISLQSKASGSIGNYSLSATNNSSVSFSTSTSGASLTGGADGTTTYDSGTCAVTINGTRYSASFGQGSSSGSIAAALASAINGGSVASASVSGATVSLSGNGSGISSVIGGNCSYNSSVFSSTSFAVSTSSPTDSGTVTVSYQTQQECNCPPVTTTATAHYGAGSGQDSSAATVAADLVSQMTAQGSSIAFSISPTDATTIVLTIAPTLIKGFNSGPVSCSSATSNPGTFSPSFTCPSSVTLSGGAAPYPSSIAHPYVTTYGYDPIGDLLTVTQGQQTRSYAYDSLRRMTSSKIPEAGNQATTFSYTDFGAVATKLDPRGITTTYSYNDPLNRLTSVAYSSGTPTDSYAYGNPGDANFTGGRLKSASNSIASEIYQYDNMGRRTQVAKTIGGNPYTVGYAYNPDGTLLSTTYPSGRVVTDGYDAIGRLTGVSAGSTTYLAINSYNAAGQVLTTTYGNTMTGRYTYNNQMQLGSILAQNALPVLSLAYNYGGAQDNGQIQGITDNVNSASSTVYTYDALSRLSAAGTVAQTGAGTWGLSFGYDRYGNRTSETAAYGSLSMPSSQLMIDATTNHITTSGFNYDPDGNLTSDSATNYTFDGANRVSTATPIGGGSTTSYYYDAASQRVNKNGTLDIYDHTHVIAEYANGALASSPSAEYIYAGDQRVANVIAGATTYDYWDHLSIRVNGDASGNVIRNSSTFPYGESMQDTGSVSSYVSAWKFTTFERDSESNLDHAWFRQYGFLQGRWTTPDPYLGSMDIANPQSLDRYNYVLNNPAQFVDPLGLDLETTFLVGNCLVTVDYLLKEGGGISITGVSTFCGGGGSSGGGGGGGGNGNPTNCSASGGGPGCPQKPPACIPRSNLTWDQRAMLAALSWRAGKIQGVAALGVGASAAFSPASVAGGGGSIQALLMADYQGQQGLYWSVSGGPTVGEEGAGVVGGSQYMTSTVPGVTVKDVVNSQIAVSGNGAAGLAVGADVSNVGTLTVTIGFGVGGFGGLPALNIASGFIPVCPK